MCTASWILRPGGYELFFNRDELRTRGAARPPALDRAEDVRFVAPVDADAGGTWLAVNELGLTLGLLNAEGESPAAPVSRGLLVRSLVASATREDVAMRLEETELSSFRGFRLLAFEPDEPPEVFAWDGAALSRSSARLPVASSSWGTERAEATRASVLLRLFGTSAVGPTREDHAVEALERFHRSHEPERGALSPCMHRADAHTVSASRVSVGVEEVRFHYAAGAPCRSEWEPALVLPRG